MLLATSLAGLPVPSVHVSVGLQSPDVDGPVPALPFQWESVGSVSVVKTTSHPPSITTVRVSQPAPAPEIVLAPEGDSSAVGPAILLSSPWTLPNDDVPLEVDDPANLGLPAPMSRGEILAVPELTEGSEVHLSGTLGPDQMKATFRMAVGPTTQNVKIKLASDPGSPGSSRPAVEDILLTDARGQILAVILGAYEKWLDAPSEMTVALSHIPRGADLIIRIIQAPVSPGPSAPPSDGSAGDLTFTMDLRRTEAIGLLPLPTQALTDAFFSPVNLVFPLNSPPGLMGTPAARSPTPSLGSRDEAASNWASDPPATNLASESSPSNEDALGVSVGPLVSRGSSAVGPALATTQDEETTPVDRRGGAFDLASWPSATAGDGVAMREATTPTADGWPAGRSAAHPARRGRVREGIELLRGPGGLPLLASSAAGTGDPGDPSELIATLPESAGHPRMTEGDDSPIQACRDAQAPPHRREKKLGLWAALWGIALGVTLASTPHYPDLMGRLRFRMTRIARVAARGGRGKRRPR
ncbi:hypothetical protein OJF2_21030 [Aquisphaera giovannonii]|uniref:Uncharacterized protein n=1 Tax=Aquisphaera giovannonii TaxID=406548 RepID=A0A5B9W034_9BACT|nr:hypothetical protein [Aquisphaera giovannonii]QEH33599.1 hypothetical protein OJF2_21030 [Aquisphaera giovannonii]